MEIPSQVRVGTQVFDVVLRSRHDDGMLNDNNYGYTLDTENLIVIDSCLAFSKQRTTLIHELLHAIHYVFDNSIRPTSKDSFENWEHYFIGVYEEALIMLVRDNPELVEFLKK